MFDNIVSLFDQGADSYYAGEVPEGWDNPEVRERSPYIMGWYMASMVDNDPEWLDNFDGSY